MMNRRRAAVGALLGCLACGGSGGNTAPSISVSPSTTSVTVGGGPLSFTATLNNGTGPVSWTLAGPGSITPVTGNTTSYTPPTSLGAPTTASLTASAGGVHADAIVTINLPASINVSGTVVDPRLQKFPGVAVTIGSQSTVTDATGHFSIANVTPPYDLTAIGTLRGDKAASVYKGLTRPDPTLMVNLALDSTENTGTLTGAVSGGDPLATVGNKTAVLWTSPQATLFQGAGANIVSSPYTLNPHWDPELPSITGDVRVLQWAVDTNGLPAAYKGYAVRTAVAVAAGGTTSNLDLTMSAPGSATVAGSVTVPPNFTPGQRSLRVAFGGNGSIFLGSDSGTQSMFSYLLPNVSGATATITTGGYDSLGNAAVAEVSGIALGTTNASIVIPSPNAPVLPPDTATGVGTGTDFIWTPISGGTVIYMFGIVSAGHPSYSVFTTGTSARIPDLSAQGLGLPGAASYVWYVQAFGPHASLDSAAGPNSIVSSGNSTFQAFTKNRSFTTP